MNDHGERGPLDMEMEHCWSRIPTVMFLPKFKGFRGNGSSESTRFPEGLVLGNSVKPWHPQNVGLSNIMKHVHEGTIEKGDMKNPDVFLLFHKFLNKRESNGRTSPLYSNF
jgi:hypothetical protein